MKDKNWLDKIERLDVVLDRHLGQTYNIYDQCDFVNVIVMIRDKEEGCEILKALGWKITGEGNYKGSFKTRYIFGARRA
jgi:hypothetical protein